MLTNHASRARIVGNRLIASRGSRLALGGIGLALLGTAGLIILPSDHRGVGASSAQADPRRVLKDAAALMRSLPDTIPKPSQFYYVKDGTYEAWLSMDGTTTGQVISDGTKTEVPGCQNGKKASGGNQPSVESCVPDPAYLSDAPTTGPAMSAYLAKSDSKPADVNSLGKEVMSDLQFKYLRPAARGALFEAAEAIPGIRTVKSDSEGLGSNEIGISWTAPGGGSTLLVFDAKSHSYRGVHTTGADGSGAGSSSPEFAIVDTVGQRPH